MEQISLFDLDNFVLDLPVNQTIINVSDPKPVVKVKPDPVKAVLSDEIQERISKITNERELCKFMNSPGFYISSRYRFPGNEYILTGDGVATRTGVYNSALPTVINSNLNYSSKADVKLIYFDESGKCWYKACKFTVDNDHYNNRVNRMLIEPSSAKMRRLSSFPIKFIYLQSEEERKRIFKEKMPYTYKFSQEQTKYHWDVLMMCPQIESLDKAGYKFVDDLQHRKVYELDADVINSFNRLIKFEDNPGKLQNIFKTTKTICKLLKDERKLAVWDKFRKLEKFSNSSPDELRIIYANNYSESNLSSIQRILSHKYEGKLVFSFTSLINYLNRLDQYEAIETDEALMLIEGYLNACNLLEMKPKTDGDSLKREHDIAARLVRIRRNELEAKRMERGCQELQKYNFENDNYIIRGCRNYDDLLDEAKQQHNCVATYSRRIGEGTSLIFFMREKTCLNRSFVTIELSPDLSTVRQKYKAFNKPLYDAEATEFIDEWQKHCKAVDKGLEEPHILSCDIQHSEIPEETVPEAATAAEVEETLDQDIPYEYEETVDQELEEDDIDI